jgi:hypothetical protein
MSAQGRGGQHYHRGRYHCVANPPPFRTGGVSIMTLDPRSWLVRWWLLSKPTEDRAYWLARGVSLCSFVWTLLGWTVFQAMLVGTCLFAVVQSVRGLIFLAVTFPYVMLAVAAGVGWCIILALVGRWAGRRRRVKRPARPSPVVVQVARAWWHAKTQRLCPWITFTEQP